MTRLLVWLVLATLVVAAQPMREEGALVYDGIPEIPKSLTQQLHQYNQVRSASLVDWRADGSGLYLTTRFANTTQLHRVDRPLGARYQLTFDEEPVSSVAVCPDPDRSAVVMTQDVGGGEAYQLVYLDLTTGEKRLVSDGHSRYGAVVWSPRGDQFACYSTERNGTDWDIWLVRPDGQRRRLTAEQGTWWPVAWSPDQRYLLVQNYRSVTDTRLYLLEIATETLVLFDLELQDIAHGDGVIASDGSVYYTSDKDSQFLSLRRYWRGQDEVVLSGLEWNITHLELDPSGSRLAYSVNQDGLSRLFLMDLDSRQSESLKIPAGIVSGFRFSPDGQRLALTLTTGQSPSDIYVLDLSSQSLERWTESEVGGLPASEFVAPTLERFPTFDGRSLSAFLYTPSDPDPAPVVVLIHGGPESQYRPYFSSTVQYLVRELGLAVVAPNVRGSDGYGKDFLKLDNGFRREDSVKDIGALLDWIESRPDLDSNRVAVYGGSYGGYMVLASLIHYSDRLRAGIDVVGISNFVTFLNNTKDYRRDLRRVEYGDERDPEMRAFLERISPTNQVDRIQVPLLVVQGQNDPRVPVTEAEQIVSAVRSQGQQAWYLLARDEGHGFRKKNNRKAYLETVALFLRVHLLP